jgi:RNA polymerase sigma factor (sigma-70 family)
MRDSLEQLLRAADAPNPERAETLWAEYRADGPGAEAAFTTLLAWYGLAIYRRIWGFVRSDAAEDVFQDVLTKWHQNRQRLASFANDVLPWLRAVAVRQCVDAYRRTTRRKTREARRAVRPEDDPPPGAQLELQEVLAVALARLSRTHREVVALVYFEGMDKQDAASVLGINRNTLARQLDAALERLKDLIPVPATLALGGTVGIQGVLVARPPVPPVIRLAEAVKAAWAKATATGPSLWKVAATLLVGLAGLTGVALATWPRPAPPVAASTGSPTSPLAPAGEETLQAKNVRLTRRDVVPLVVPELQKFLPPDNPVRLVDVRGFGSKVECEFCTTKPLLGKPAGLRIRYCVLRRWLEMDSDLYGTGTWTRTDPERPIFLDFEFPLLRRKEVVIGREQAEAVRRAFDRLPGDDRAERESVAYWFGSPRPAEGKLVLPKSWRAMDGNSRELFFHAPDEGLYVLRDGEWRYGGYCPGWLGGADDARLYRFDPAWGVYTRPIDPPDAPWVRFCRCPQELEQKLSSLVFWRAGGGFLFLTAYETAGPALWVRSLTDPDARWVRESWPSDDPTLITIVGNRLVSVRGDGMLIARPIGGGDWVPVCGLPGGFKTEQSGTWGITGWRGRVLISITAGGPLFARSLDPGETWQVVGRTGPLTGR